MVRIEGREFEAMLMPIYLKVDFEENSNTTVSGGSKDASDWLPVRLGLASTTAITGRDVTTLLK
jgi:hypothetical protein